MPMIDLYHQNVHIHEELEPHTFGCRANLYLHCVDCGRKSNTESQWARSTLRLSIIHSVRCTIVMPSCQSKRLTRQTNIDHDWRCIQHIFTVVESNLKKPTLLFNRLPYLELSVQAERLLKHNKSF